MTRHSAVAQTAPFCTSCGQDPLSEQVVICGDCVWTDGVSIHCRGCKGRWHFDVERARRLLHALGKEEAMARPGVVIVLLERCLMCRAAAAPRRYPHRILVAELPHSLVVH